MNSFNNRKEVTRNFTIVLSLLVFLWMLYTVFGHEFIKAMYYGKSPLLFSNIMQSASIYPVESYYEIADNFVRGFLFLVVTILIISTLVFYPDFVNKWDSKQYFVYSGLISLIFLSTLLIYGPTNNEDHSNLITSVLVSVKYLFNGKILYWYDGRGFGTPFPTTPAPNTHPIYMLSPFISLRLVYTAFWVIHMWMGCFFFIKISRLMNLGKRFSLINGFLFVFSLPSINYQFYDDWNGGFVLWTMYPLIVYLSFKVILDKSYRIRYSAILLPVIIAIMALNSLASMYLSKLIILAICLLFVLSIKPKLNKLILFIFIFILTCILVSPKIYYTLNELSYFPEGIIGHSQIPFNLKSVILTNLNPISPSFLRLIWPGGESFDIGLAFSSAISRSLFHNPRQPFIGFVYLILALSSVVYLLRFFFKTNIDDHDKLKAAVILAFILGFVGMLTDNSLFLDTVSTWTMRDEMIFFGIISASIQIQSLKKGFLKNRRAVIQLMLIIQITQLLAYTSYLVYFAKGDSYFYKKTRTNAFNFFQPLANGDELFDWFTKSKSLYGDRVLLSPLIEKDLGSESNKLAKENLYSIPDINIYTELNIVNDVNLKGISMDRIYSSSTYTKGSINSNYDVIRNTALLDIAGINWVLIKKTELEENRPFSNLLEKDNFTFSWKDEVWVLLHNPDAWPKAFVMSAGVLNLTSAYRENCGHSGILCAHMEQYLPFKRNIKVRKVGADGHVQLSIPSQSENIVLGLSTMYRPEWEALANGEKLIVRPLFDAFIGVEVPSGISNITLDFNPKVRIWLNYLSLSAFVLCFAGIVVLISREKRQNKFLIKQ